MSAPSLAVGLDVCLKATLILSFTALAVRARGRASAAARHLIWTVGLASSLALPLVSDFEEDDPSLILFGFVP